MSAKKELLAGFARNIIYFGKIIRPSVFEVESPDFHKKIAAYLRRSKFSRINIIAPRGFAKTTLVGYLYTLWHIFIEDYANNRKRQPKFVVIVSKSRGHSINILTSIKQTLNTSGPLRTIFGDWGEETAIQWREDKIILKDGTIIDCRGMGQQVRGMNINNRRPTLIVLDDAEDENNTKTDQSIADNRKWFLNALMPMVKRTHPEGRIINIGTPQTQSCLVFTLKEMSMWTNMHFSAIIEDENGDEQSLWPELMPLEELHNIRDDMASIGRVSAFYREYLCEVVGDEDALVVPEDLRFWDGRLEIDETTKRPTLVVTHRGHHSEPKPLDQVERIPVFLFMGVDPASTLSLRSDYSVCFVIAVDNSLNRYCLHYDRKRRKPMGVCEMIITNFESFPLEKTRIESVGYQDMLRDYLRQEYKNYIPGLEIKHNPRSSKSHRLESLQPKFAQHKVWVKRGMDEFVEELLLYPRAKHDDTLDGFYYADLNCYGPIDGTTDSEQARIDKELRHFGFTDKLDPSEDWLLA